MEGRELRRRGVGRKGRNGRTEVKKERSGKEGKEWKDGSKEGRRKVKERSGEGKEEGWEVIEGRE